MSFTFDDTIPAANNNPSADQPVMLANNVSTLGILAVDHITFNANNGGMHQQMHLPSFTAPAVVNGTATEGSVLYSAAGSADAARAQLFFKNDLNVNYPGSLIRAYGVFDGTGAVQGSQSINITSVTAVGIPTNRTYAVVLPVNVVTGNFYGIHLTASLAGLGIGIATNYIISGPTAFTIVFRQTITGATVVPDFMTITVYQI